MGNGESSSGKNPHTKHKGRNKHLSESTADQLSFPPEKGRKKLRYFSIFSPPILRAGRKEEKKRGFYETAAPSSSSFSSFPLSLFSVPCSISEDLAWNSPSPHLVSLENTIIFHKYGRNRVPRAKKNTLNIGWRILHLQKQSRTHTAVCPKTARKKTEEEKKLKQKLHPQFLSFFVFFPGNPILSPKAMQKYFSSLG